MPNVVSLTRPSLQILDKGISDFRIPGQSSINVNCHNSRASHNIGMKLRPVTKLDKKNPGTSKKLTIMSCRQIETPLFLFRFMANLQPSGGRNPDVWSIKFKFSLTVTFYLTELENRTKIFLTQLLYYCFE